LVFLGIVAAVFAWGGGARAQQTANAAGEAAESGMDLTSGEEPADKPEIEVVMPRQRILAWVRVVSAQAEIRSGPSRSYPAIETVLEGEEFEATGRVRGWYFISFGDDAEGWIESRAVRRLPVEPSYDAAYRQPPPQYYYPYPYWWGGTVYFYDRHYYRDHGHGYRRGWRYDHDRSDHGHTIIRPPPPPGLKREPTVAPPPPPGVAPPVPYRR
jgi:hypothetical protein